MQVERVIDIRNMFCPTPLAHLSRELKKVPVGAKVKVLANDKGFERDIKVWAHDTGNRLISLEKKDGEYEAILERGKGWHGDTLWEKIKFYAVGIKLHLIMYLLEIFKPKKPKYLITFISIPEGFRAIEFLEKKGITDFIALPVPDEIYEYCGIVIGFKNKKRALDVFNLLKENGFGVEDVREVDKERKYPILPESIQCS